MNKFLGIKGTKDEVGKLDVFKIQKWVMEQYNVNGRLTSISEDELEVQTKEYLPGAVRQVQRRQVDAQGMAHHPTLWQKTDRPGISGSRACFMIALCPPPIQPARRHFMPIRPSQQTA